MLHASSTYMQVSNLAITLTSSVLGIVLGVKSCMIFEIFVGIDVF